MRPRHKAAENARGDDPGDAAFGHASMRPRHKAAENGLHRLPQPPAALASMRPRHKAAENAGMGRSLVLWRRVLQ